MKKISIFGLGYVGTVSSACLAKLGHRVVGVDINNDKVGMINAGESPIVEPGLSDLLSRTAKKKGLSATTDAVAAVRATTISMIWSVLPHGCSRPPSIVFDPPRK